ncbi:MAG: LON peptidase substrate-binding domain-containing protein [Hyphomicrobium sp.]
MGWIEHYRAPKDLPQCIPVFPLHGAILLPRATLPLNVFEPRYLEMIKDVLREHRILGIIQPKKANNQTLETESPEGKKVILRSIGCAGRLTSFQEMDDGRLGITLTGIARFDVVKEMDASLPYRLLDVIYDRFVEDFSTAFGEDKVDRSNLLRVLKVYLKQNRLHADWKAIERASSESLINALSVMAPYGSEEKQALLEAPDLKSRAEVLIALAEMEIATSGGSGNTIQ